MLIEIPHHIILIIGDSALLGGFKLGDNVLDFFGVDETIVSCISDEELILYYIHEF